jgi:hypothetical protein
MICYIGYITKIMKGKKTLFTTPPKLLEVSMEGVELWAKLTKANL